MCQSWPHIVDRRKTCDAGEKNLGAHDVLGAFVDKAQFTDGAEQATILNLLGQIRLQQVVVAVVMGQGKAGSIGQSVSKDVKTYFWRCSISRNMRDDTILHNSSMVG